MTVQVAEKWLKILAIIHIIGGLALPILVFTPLSAPYFDELTNRFANSNPESLRFLIGIFGPTVASWGLLFYYAIGKAFQSLKLSDWWILLCAILVWVILDSAYSWYFGIYSHLVINSIMLVLILIPFISVKRFFKDYK